MHSFRRVEVSSVTPLLLMSILGNRLQLTLEVTEIHIVELV
jgi:hypothetical protein